MPDANREANRHAAKQDVAGLRDGQETLERDLVAREARTQDVVERVHVLSSELNAATADVLRWRSEAIRRRGELVGAKSAARGALAKAAAAHEISEDRGARLDAIVNTVSWKVTRPLRAVRRVGKRRSEATSDRLTPALPASADSAADPTAAVDEGLVRRFCDRVGVVTNLLDPDQVAESGSLEQAILSFECAVDNSQASVMTKAWLALVSVLGTYPEEPTLEEAARVCRLTGGLGLGELMLDHLEQASHDPAAVDSEVEVERDGVLVDVSHTAAHDLHTGIQRVVRELSSRWLSKPQVALMHWNFSTNSVKRLSDDEAERLRNWRNHLHDPGTAVQSRALAEQTGKTVIPWGCVLVFPELVIGSRICSGYRALTRSGVVSRCSLIGYDFVPTTAAETVSDGMIANFGHYLSLVKHSSHMAAISEAAAEEFRAYAQMLRSQGLPGPTVTALPLPTVAPEISDDDLESARREFDVSVLPVVAVVGSHEPRKNHLVVLEAAESMWRAGQAFDLIFAGGSSWGGSMFDTYVKALSAQGFPVRVYERVDEKSLWALYRLAYFSVFPSLLEGYGLPIAESLASGTPVITSNHGSMAEIGRKGGAILVDPRDSVELASAMTSLLVDTELRNRMASQARARVFPTWDKYADSVWIELVGQATK